MTVQPTRDQLRALADKATPGPWDTYMIPPERNRAAYVAVEAGETEIRIARYEGGHFDGAFIAAARTALPQLLDQLDAMEADRDWNLRSSRLAKKDRIKANARAEKAEARIKAVQDVLDRWQVDGYDALLRRIRRALESVPPPSA